MQKIRVFFSFHVPESVGTRLLAALPTAAPVQWYPQENLHVTLRFVGEVSDEELEKLYIVGDVVAAESPAIRFVPEKLALPDNRLRYLMRPNEPLIALHRNIITCLEKITIGKKDPQPYAPHITLGRVNGVFNPETIHLNPNDYEFDASEFGLYKSEPGEQKMGQYVLIKSFPLKK